MKQIALQEKAKNKTMYLAGGIAALFLGAIFSTSNSTIPNQGKPKSTKSSEAVLANTSNLRINAHEPQRPSESFVRTPSAVLKSSHSGSTPASAHAEKIVNLTSRLDKARPDFPFAQTMLENFRLDSLQVREAYLDKNSNDDSYISADQMIHKGTRLVAIYLSSCLTSSGNTNGETIGIRKMLGPVHQLGIKNSVVAVPLEVDQKTSAFEMQKMILSDPCLAGLVENTQLTTE